MCFNYKDEKRCKNNLVMPSNSLIQCFAIWYTVAWYTQIFLMGGIKAKPLMVYTHIYSNSILHTFSKFSLNKVFFVSSYEFSDYQDRIEKPTLFYWKHLKTIMSKYISKKY